MDDEMTKLRRDLRAGWRFPAEIGFLDMSSFEINKIVGAVLMVALVVMVIGMVGDRLVQPRDHQAELIAAAPEREAPAAEAEPEEAPPIGPLLADANVERGETAARRCITCHTFKQGEPHRMGPNLWDIVGADIGAKDGYNYSGAMAGADGNWTYEKLNAFLIQPRNVVRGTKMVFAGLRSEQERADLIAYMRTLSDSPKPLPEAGAAEPQAGAAEEGKAEGAEPAAR